MSGQNSREIHWLLIPIFLVIWSSAFAIARVALEHAAPLWMLSLRFAIAAALAAILAWLLREARPAWRDILALTVIGIVNHTLYLGLSYIGMREVSAGLTAVIVSANPVLTAVLAAVLLNERMTLPRAGGLLFGAFGVALILQHRVDIGTEHWTDFLWPLGALAALSGGAILFKRLGRSQDGFSALAVQLAAAATAALLPALLLEDSPAIVDLPQAFWLSILFQAVLASVGAYAIWFHLLQKVGASAASAWHFLIPPLGILFGVLMLNESVIWMDLIGIGPVVVGIWLANRSTGRGSRRHYRHQ